MNYLVSIGASDGGLEALGPFFARMAPDTGAAFVVVVHPSPESNDAVPDVLSRHTTMPVRWVDDQMVPEPNAIYLMPPGQYMTFRDGRLRLEAQDRGGHVQQGPIDIFLCSLAGTDAHLTTAVILSGAGSDGSRGIRDLKEAGGTVMVQAPDTAKFDGKPRSALDTGVADAQGTPAHLAELVGRVIRHRGSLRDRPDGDSEDDVLAVLSALRAQRNVDLSYLRPTMLRRRIQRRMTLLGIESNAEYVERLRTDGTEARTLAKDTMIGVTGFFRDGEAFHHLGSQLAAALTHSPADQQFRIWVPACASGEEVYSIGMLVLETLQGSGLERDVKIFATDIDDDALFHAGQATYPISLARDIGPSRVTRFFGATSASLVARKELRELVVFAHHNLVKDPPFSRINLISCRNLLIYLRPEAQRQAVSSLHFALRKHGLLFLGSAESLGDLEPEFEVVDPSSKLFRKLAASSVALTRTRTDAEAGFVVGRPGSSDRRNPEANLRSIVEALAAADDRSIAILTPEGILVDIIADPVGVFRMASGRPSTDVLRLIIDRLTLAVRAGLQRLQQGDQEVRHAVPVAEEGGRPLRTILRRLPATGSQPERVLFVVEAVRPGESASGVEPSALDPDSATQLRELQEELVQTRESFHATIEELQSANEEQQSKYEEQQTASEVDRSANEELQSVNEELLAVNIEHQQKHRELTVLAADLNNLLQNINVGVLFLDADLTIRKFTPAIEPILPLRPQDIGRSIEHFAHKLGPDFVADVQAVARTGEMRERETRSLVGAWLLLRIRPYLADSDQPHGVVATFVDVTALKNAHELARAGSLELASTNRELVVRRQELEEMFSIVAHDLKRPVVALDGLLWLMANDLGGGDDPVGMLARAQGECNRMRQMLLDLEGIAGIQRREMRVEEVSLQTWLDELVARYRPEAERRGVRLNCTSDPGRHRLATSFLAEIAGNLLENALKYGSQGPAPRVDVSCRVLDDVLDLSVADNGPGIDPANHEQIFEPFRRLNPALCEGSGVGLMAVKRLLQRVAGVISVVSTPGEGAKFTARVPLPRRAEAGGRDGALLSHVLLVEDEDLDAKVIQGCLGDRYLVTRARSMEQAEKELRHSHFDLVLLDLSLPDGHGFQLVARVRELLGRSVPVVVISGQGDGVGSAGAHGLVGGFIAKAEMNADILKRELALAVSTAALNQVGMPADGGSNRLTVMNA